jgi:hypothetical protein
MRWALRPSKSETKLDNLMWASSRRDSNWFCSLTGSRVNWYFRRVTVRHRRCSGTRSSPASVGRRCFVSDGSVDESTASQGSALPGAGCSTHAFRLWETAAYLRAGRGRPNEGLEDDSLATRQQGMAGIAIRGPVSPAFAWLRPWPTTTQGSLVADRMARVGKGTNQVFPV